jgi:hypothetical protein
MCCSSFRFCARMDCWLLFGKQPLQLTLAVKFEYLCIFMRKVTCPHCGIDVKTILTTWRRNDFKINPYRCSSIWYEYGHSFHYLSTFSPSSCLIETNLNCHAAPYYECDCLTNEHRREIWHTLRSS